MPHIEVDSPGGVGVGRQLNFCRSSLSAARTSNIVGNVRTNLVIYSLTFALPLAGVQLLHVILNSLMQYVLCPRCKFKVPVNKHLCSTCGYVMPVYQGASDTRSTVVISPEKQQGFWATLFGVAEESKDESQDQDSNAAIN